MNLRGMMVLLLLSPITGFAQQLMLGNPCGAMDSSWLDPLNFTENPAACTAVSSLQLGIFGGQYRDVKGLNFFSAAFVMPLKNLAVGVVLHHNGTTGYQYNKLNILLAKNLGELSIGVMFN